MTLYHGSQHNFSAVRKSQAQAGEGIKVPDGELLEAIYLTPSYEFALAIAAMPDGAANIDYEAKTIEFENLDSFDPEQEVYIYEFDESKILPENLRKVDELQYAVVGMDELVPDHQSVHKAGELKQYFEIKEGKREKEVPHSEMRFC
jgi:hypothetical protein